MDIDANRRKVTAPGYHAPKNCRPSRATGAWITKKS